LKKVSFNNKNNSFSDAIHSDVKAYFEQTGKKQTGDWRLYIKTLTLIPASLLIYIVLLMNFLPGTAALALSAVLGFLLACIGFSVMHDACHGSYSESKRLNYIMGLTMNALGSNAFIWKIKHNIIHHTYTNIDGVDDDIAKSPVLRHCYSQPYKPIHKWQHIYMVPLYAISSILWALVTDMDKYFKKSINGTPIHKIPMQEHVLFWLTKALYVVFYIALPIYFVGVGPFLAGYFLMSAVTGLTLGLVFQLAHVVETTEFVDASHLEGKMSVEDAWAVHQIRTTSNFATNSKLVSWFVGGLNFQVEHHLFPKISHVHYPAISKIVEARCKEFGLPYNNISTFGLAVASHFRTMRNFGQSEHAPMMHAAA
jgi:linoleoyl-CoA desaturase